MKFLCLHGVGSNSETFEIQTAALRYQLGDNHEYDFAEGHLSAPVAPELEEYHPSEDQFFAYANSDDPQSCIAAVDLLGRYVDAEGPFDGVIAFSQGAGVVASYLAHQNRLRGVQPFKCAVFFSSAVPFTLGSDGGLRQLVEHEDGLITVPTAHIWSKNESSIGPEAVSRICEESSRQVFVHGGKHEIPGSRADEDVKACVRIIRRVIQMSS